MDRQIEERCAANGIEKLEAIKNGAAPKTRIDDHWEAHQKKLVAHHEAHAAKMREEGEMLRQANNDHQSSLQGMEAKIDLNLRRSVTERSAALQQAATFKRHAEAARHTSNKRKLKALVKKAKARTEIELAPEVLDGLSALEREKRSRAKTDRVELAAANKAAERRLRNAAAHSRVFDDSGNALGLRRESAHEQKRREIGAEKDAKREEERRAAKVHRKHLEQLAAGAKPRTVVALSPAHEARLESLTQKSEERQRLQREATREHERRLNALTASSARKIELPPVASKLIRTGSAQLRAATIIQAARRGSIGRQDADAARMAAAAARDNASQKASPSRLVARLQNAVALAHAPALQSRHVQRRRAITPYEQHVMSEAVAVAAMPVAAAA